MQNFVYAGVEGNIGYYGAGRVPVREKGNGTLPVPGWTDEYEWTGTIPFEALPHTINPPEGIIVTANNKSVPDDYPYFLSHTWFAPYRAERILSYFTGKEKLSFDDMVKAQGDIVSIPAKKTVPYLISVESDDPLVETAKKMLKDWDCHLKAGSAAAGIFEVASMHLLAAIVSDELGDSLTKDYMKLFFQSGHQQAMFVENLLKEPQNRWWDDVTTPAKETMQDIISRALQTAVTWLSEKMGNRMERWQWGVLHNMNFKHGVFSDVWILKWFFNVDIGPIGGDAHTPNATFFLFDKPYATAGGPSFRQIVEVGNWDNSLAIIPPGQCGHAFHPHYGDLALLWRDMKYHPMHWSKDKVVEASDNETLVLVP
jgi:penicillin amidase